MKAGWKTTEFWASLAVSASQMLIASGAFASSPVLKIASIVAAVATCLGYQASRTVVKRGEWRQDDALLQELREGFGSLRQTLGRDP